jgi:O-antigen ligase
MKLRWNWIASLYLGACVVMGGASAAGAAANAALQVAALLLILLVMWRGTEPMIFGEGRPLAVLFAVTLLIGGFSLVPLPPAWWSHLPFRDQIADAFVLIGMAPPPLPLSLAPPATLASLVSFLPPAAAFLLVLQISAGERRAVAWATLVLAGLSLALGAFQLIGGPESSLRFYEITNAGSPVGFFANVNHQVTLILCALVFTGVLSGRAALRRSPSKRRGALVLSAASAVFLITGIAISGSGAGYALLPISLVAAFVVYRRTVRRPIGRAWLAAGAAALVVFGAVALRGPLSTQALSLDLSNESSSRRVLSQNTIKAIEASFPAGTGLGSFVDIYRRFENPNRVLRQYANHAHDDYLEVTLELGLPGVLLMLSFILWWLRASLRVWRSDLPGGDLGRAGSAIVGIMLLHSLVDYPLRTAALSALLAAACALMIPGRARAERSEADGQNRAKSLRHLEAAV